MKLAADIDVYAGVFASQQLAFAHLLDAAERQGLSPDLDHVEVIAPPYLPRLAGIFGESEANAMSRQAGDRTLVLILPGALVTGRFNADDRLDHLGRVKGTITRAVAE